MQPWDKLIESGRLQEILAKGLAFVVYTTFRWNNFNWDLFLLICSLDVNQPCPMLWYKPKFTQGLVLLFINCWLHGHCFRELTILLLCILGQRYDRLLLGKSWPFFLMVDHACHIPNHPPPPVTPSGNSGDFNLKIMTGMLVVSLSGRNCRVWFHLGYSGR